MTTTTNTSEAIETVPAVRSDLASAAAHWSEVANEHADYELNHPDEKVDERRSAQTFCSALMAASYSYALAALLGQMAESERGGEQWTAEEAARFVQDMLINGDADDLNGDVLPELGSVAKAAV